MNMPSIAGKLSPTATNMIRMDHTHTMATFHQYEIDASPRTKQGLVNTICLALEIHAQLEEEIFYPALRAMDSSNPAIQKAVPEHNEMKRLIAKLRGMRPTEAGYDDTLFELMRDVMHHVADEETILLPEAERLMGDRLGDLGAQMLKRRVELAAPRGGEIATNMLRGMPKSTMMLAAGALMAGTYLMKRNGNHTRHDA
ncbi:hemerythrin domain-containing protein [Noviherbaspirillum sp. L7-7A]|jgi:hemerythrin superfamily protein|uniref:hemerythrin domain-containing protein n=1 Tax=Noviherbaspirillum sp. L7-7A TaxID=2850560 RepID=UPI0020136FE2|nr:hemerythrin domain-containing protein [Noviherbaspirillum sp. L7-7A]